MGGPVGGYKNPLGWQHAIRAVWLLACLYGLPLTRAGQVHAGDAPMATDVQQIAEDAAQLKERWLSRRIDAVALDMGLRDIEIAARRLRAEAQSSSSGAGRAATVVAAPASRTIEPVKDSDLASGDRAKIYEKQLEDTLATHISRDKIVGGGTPLNAQGILSQGILNQGMAADDRAFLNNLEHACSAIRRAVASGAATSTIDGLVRALADAK